MNAPQNTPTMEQPLSSARFSGIFGNVAGGEADHQEATVPGHVAQRRLGVGAAHRIVDDVHATPAVMVLTRARRSSLA